MEDLAILFFAVRTPYLDKFCFTSYRPKYSHPNRLQNSLITNILGRDAWISLFFVWRYSPRKYSIQDCYLWLCPGMFSHTQMCSCPIRLQNSLIVKISGRKESNVLDFLDRDTYQGKIECQTTTVSWVRPGVHSHAQLCQNLSVGNFGWSGGGKATIKIICNERLVKL